MGGYAGIGRVAIGVGNYSFEIDDINGTYWKNGLDQGNSTPAPFSMGGYNLGVDTSSPGLTEFQLNISSSPVQFIRVSQYFHGLSIAIQGNVGSFAGSSGMCGSWDVGGVLKPDGTPFGSAPVNTLDYALAWQVNTTESLFGRGPLGVCTANSVCSSKFPEPATEEGFPCKLPGRAPADGTADNGKTRRLGMLQDKVGDPGNYSHRRRKLQEAPVCARTCTDIPASYPELRLNCIFDVIVSGDSTFACDPAYVKPVLIRDDPCKKPEFSPCIEQASLGKCHKCCKDKFFLDSKIKFLYCSEACRDFFKV